MSIVYAIKSFVKDVYRLHDRAASLHCLGCVELEAERLRDEVTQLLRDDRRKPIAIHPDYDLVYDHMGEAFDCWLDETYGAVELLGCAYSYSRVVKEVGEVSYRETYLEWVDVYIRDRLDETLLNKVQDAVHDVLDFIEETEGDYATDLDEHCLDLADKLSDLIMAINTMYEDYNVYIEEVING